MSKQKSPIKRIEFLAKKFNVFDDEDLKKIANKDFYLPNGEKCEALSEDNNFFALYTFNKRLLKNEGKYLPTNIRVADFIFIDIVRADPTQHKEYVQWMLTTFTRLIKENENEQAVNFVTEDLWLAKDYLEIFYKNRTKPKFKELCRRNLAFKDITNPSDINQYRDLSQLFDAVDPFIEKDVSKLERDMRVMARLKHASIPYEDRQVMIFNPLTIQASRLFSNLTNWCTTSNRDTHKSYIKNHKTPTGRRSKLHVLIPKTYLISDIDDPNKTEDIYQFHFETGQFMNRKDGSISDIPALIERNVGLRTYFYNTLLDLALECKLNKLDNHYINALFKFGFSDVLFDIYPDNTKYLRFHGYDIGDTPDISRFKDVETVYLVECKVTSLDSSIAALKRLKILVLTDNKLKNLPKSIGKLKNLKVLNIKGNRIKSLPQELSQLDKANGGSLEVISVDDELVEEAEGLFPSLTVNRFKEMMSK